MNFKILVIGDSCEDIFIYGKSDRLSPEGPVPVFIPLYETKTGGMSKNVVSNLNKMGADVDLITNRNKIKKTRYVDDSFNYLFLRVDEPDWCERIDLKTLPDLTQYHAIIISDYNKGFLTERDIEIILSEHPFVFIDTKKKLGNWVKNAFLIKINFNEYQNNLDLLNKDNTLFNKTIVTRGKFGCDFRHKNYPTMVVDVKDVTGAGDTFLSAFVWKYLYTEDIEDSIRYANECSTIVVQKRGISTI
jgi:D-beta-D-heptose 7-phosphate kinase/D-beta-D-heptose 1-phosphate adenosyltransferase